MRVTERTASTLVVEEGGGTYYMVGAGAAVIGAGLASIGWVKDMTLFLIVGPLFLLYGIKVLVFSRARTHRFERAARRIVIDARGLFGSGRRELAFASIADLVLEERRGRHTPSYYIFYLTRDGERIPWSMSYDGSKEGTLECFRAGREFLGISTPSIGG